MSSWTRSGLTYVSCQSPSICDTRTAIVVMIRLTKSGRVPDGRLALGAGRSDYRRKTFSIRTGPGVGKDNDDPWWTGARTGGKLGVLWQVPADGNDVGSLSAGRGRGSTRKPKLPDKE